MTNTKLFPNAKQYYLISIQTTNNANISVLYLTKIRSLNTFNTNHTETSAHLFHSY